MFYLFPQFILEYGTAIGKHKKEMGWIPVKFLILTLSLLLELHILQERDGEFGLKVQSRLEVSSPETVVALNNGEASNFFKMFADIFLLILVLATVVSSFISFCTLLGAYH